MLPVDDNDVADDPPKLSFQQQRNIDNDQTSPSDPKLQQPFQDFVPDRRMNDPIRHSSLRGIRKDYGSKLVPVKGLAEFLVLENSGAEMFDEFVVTGVSGFDDKTGEKVTVDEGDVERLDCLCYR